jgi:hypothetical protein
VIENGGFSIHREPCNEQVSKEALPSNCEFDIFPYTLWTLQDSIKPFSWLIPFQRHTKPKVLQEIDFRNNPNIPPIVYKYRDWSNPYHRTVLSEKSIFMAPPTSFEDEKD